MRKPAQIVLLAASLLLSGCVITRYEPAIQGSEQDEFRALLAKSVLGVVRPPEPEGLYAAQSFLRKISRNPIFKEAAFVDELHSKPDLLLSAYRGNDIAIPEGFQC